MKTIMRLVSVFVILSGAIVTTYAHAEGAVSYNVGFASEYYYRGTF